MRHLWTLAVCGLMACSGDDGSEDRSDTSAADTDTDTGMGTGVFAGGCDILNGHCVDYINECDTPESAQYDCEVRQSYVWLPAGCPHWG